MTPQLEAKLAELADHPSICHQCGVLGLDVPALARAVLDLSDWQCGAGAVWDRLATDLNCRDEAEETT